MKLGTILCPVDFSEPSRRAFHCAMSIASWYRAQVIALHVAQPSHVLVGAMPEGGFFADEVAVDVALMRRRLREELVPNAADASMIATDVIVGTPADAITSYAAASKPDLVVMGTRGNSGLRHLVLGSVTEEVLRSANCPVLAIPPGAGPTPSFPFRRVLCATDFSATSVEALRAAGSLTQDVVAELTILHVMEDTDENELFVARPYDVHRHADEREAHAMETVRQLANRACDAKQQPVLRIAHGRADQEILSIAASMEADLIVLGVRGHNPLQARLFGSNTNSVVRRATCPVLTTHG